MTDAAIPFTTASGTPMRCLRAALVGAGLACALPHALDASQAQSPSAIESFTGEASPRTDAGAIGVAPDGTEKWHGPLAPYAATLAAAGLSFDVNNDEFFYANPYTANRAKDGFYAGATLIVPLGSILGLAPG